MTTTAERRETMRQKAEQLLALTAAQTAHVATVDENGTAYTREQQLTELIKITSPQQPQQ